MTDKKLRIQALTVQVSLVWDDGDELTPGPDLAPVTVSLSQARAMVEGLPAEVGVLEARMLRDMSVKRSEVGGSAPTQSP